VNLIIPDDLAELPRWAVWRMEGSAKIPYRVCNDGRASSTNPLHWGDIDDARASLATGSFSGLAFAFFKEDGLVGIDLDDSIDGNEIPKPAFRGMVERFADTYIEISPSGHGLKMWVRGNSAGEPGEGRRRGRRCGDVRPCQVLHFHRPTISRRGASGRRSCDRCSMPL
jgi:primase-polymerase (primpol)-like protein